MTVDRAIRIGWLIFAFCLLAFGVFVWPTPWESIHLRGIDVVRVNRFTGDGVLLRIH